MEWQQSGLIFKGLGQGSVADIKSVGADGNCSRDWN